MLKKVLIMADSNLAVRFTDETYASRPEVAKALGTNLIDSIWNLILSYRKSFSHELNIFDVNKAPFSITLSSNILEKTNSVENKISRACIQYGALKEGSIERFTLRSEMLKSELKYLAKSKGIIINDVALDNIVQGRNTNALYQPIVNYFNALKKFEKNPMDTIDESLIASYLEILSGGGELLSFYRIKEIETPIQKVLINREYAGAPTEQIEPLMERLLYFVNEAGVHLGVKIAAVNYMMNYIKPFESFNEEMAIIITKCVLAQNDMLSSPVVMPLEMSLCEKKDALATAARETQKSNDLTYYVIEMYKLYDEAMTTLLDRIVNVSREAVEKEYLEDSQLPPIPEKVYQEQSKPVYEEQKKEVIESANEAATPKAKKIIEVSNNEPKVNVHIYQELDEKALNRAAEDLLESDPTLRPSQAHFYVRHCSLGKYYTIQQFKKSEGCVYETARTSMDNLARRGYYRREAVKNKFVYTPISKE